MAKVRLGHILKYQQKKPSSALPMSLVGKTKQLIHILSFAREYIAPQVQISRDSHLNYFSAFHEQLQKPNTAPITMVNFILRSISRIVWIDFTAVTIQVRSIS